MTVTFAVTDPATGEVLKRYPVDTDERIGAVVATAASAFVSWGRRTEVRERAELVRRVAQLHLERRDELAEIMTREMGKPAAQGRGEVEFSAAIYQYYADNAERFLADEPVELMEGDGTAVVRRQPLGALLGIMPWNYPAYQVARFAAPNLVAGNPVILKHAPQCPESAAALEAIFHDTGAPDGVYSNVYASNGQIERIIADPRIQGVSLTGSERAGSAVAEIAGRHLKKVVLELGGSDPFILMSTSDLDAAVKAAASARLDNAGQACNAAKRIIVHESLYDDFLAKFTETLLTSDTAPLSSVAAAERLEQQVAEAVRDGAQLTTAGQRSGAHYPTGVLTGVTRQNGAFRQELFGPVAMVFRAADEAEAIDLANDTPYGLGSYVFTTDPEQADRIADQLDVGMVFINVIGADGPELPFGGVKRSGFGRELGRYSIEEFINKKMIRRGI